MTKNNYPEGLYELATSVTDKMPEGWKVIGEVIGCFDAAFAEGLQEALAETQDERLKDLVERRLMYALYAAQEADMQVQSMKKE